ncbi:MAG: RDD family protein [Vicinamibacteria bacterium]|nr:RDD family protein [Vicinamibacteria bacterium]
MNAETRICSACGAELTVSTGTPPPSAASAGPVVKTRTPAAEELRGRRKDGSNWQEEVRARIRSRLKARSDEVPLPLFDEPAADEPLRKAPPALAREKDHTEEDQASVPGSSAFDDLPLQPARSETFQRRAPSTTTDKVWTLAEPEEDADARRAAASNESLGDEDEVGEEDAGGDENEFVESQPSWAFGSAASPDDEARPLERPALLSERILAALLDGGLLASLFALVIYFASRAAKVPIAGLWVSWPYIAAYLALLGTMYAAYFTGTTGQTPGKILTGLRVGAAARSWMPSRSMVC